MKTENGHSDTLPFAGPEFFLALGAVSGKVGRSRFYRDLARFLGRIVRSQSSLVMRYARFSAPDFLANEVLSKEAVDLYLSGYYRFDPFYHYWREHGQCGVVPVTSILQHSKTEIDYFNTIYRKARIHDEIAIFLPAPGGASVALFVERARDNFAGADIERLETVYPMVASLHELHLDWVFSHSDSDLAGTLSREIPRALLMMDRDGRRVFASREWRERGGPELDRALRMLRGGHLNLAEFGDNLIVHAERLRADFPVAPNGVIYVIEHRGPAPLVADYRTSLTRFIAAHGLTAREAQIVELILSGYPTEEIRRKLRISRGTVKNHRRRLYYKLDITTERELFSLFLPYLFKNGRSGGHASAMPEDRPVTTTGSASS